MAPKKFNYPEIAPGNEERIKNSKTIAFWARIPAFLLASDEIQQKRVTLKNNQARPGFLRP